MLVSVLHVILLLHVAVQSLKTRIPRTVCIFSMKVNYDTNMSQNKYFLRVSDFKNLCTSSTKVYKRKCITIFLLNLVCESSQTLHRMPLPTKTIFNFFVDKLYLNKEYFRIYERFWMASSFLTEYLLYVYQIKVFETMFSMLK